MHTVISLIGPTAIGKTDLAIELYNKFFTDNKLIDIISVDSAMVYKELNIGTGKPSADILCKIPHNLINIRNIDNIYTVADFCEDAIELIKKSHNNNRLPLLVGGTMMYYNALFNGISSLPSCNASIRLDLNNRIKQFGLNNLYQELQLADPEYAAKISSNDSQRITRALEVYLSTGVKLSELINNNQKNKFFVNNNIKLKNIFLLPTDRADLHARIAARFYTMLEQGFIEEVEYLYDLAKTDNTNINKDLPGIRSVGYRQIWSYLSGEINKEEMIERSIIATRQLAKRQHTWMRGMIAKSNNNINDNKIINIDFKNYNFYNILSELQQII